jgi:spore coat polysaccharide biosynthesis protein SpsF (cytidylyltransferase family)
MPIGSIIECFTKKALEKAYIEASSKEDKEHVTLYMKKNEGFKLGYLKAEQEVMFPDMRLTVDFPEDFKRAEKIIKALYKNGIPQFKKIVDFVNKNIV